MLLWSGGTPRGKCAALSGSFTRSADPIQPGGRASGVESCHYATIYSRVRSPCGRNHRPLPGLLRLHQLCTTRSVNASQSPPAKAKESASAALSSGASASWRRRRARKSRVLTVAGLRPSASAVASTVIPSTSRRTKTSRKPAGNAEIASSSKRRTCTLASSVSGEVPLVDPRISLSR